MNTIVGVSVISAWQEIRNGFDFSYLLSLLLSVVPSLLCITLHELSHGLVAYKLGDPTAKNAGRLTLNPLKHLDPVGLLMMMTVHVGWAKPVPVNMYRFKNPKRGMAVTALAGPVSNVLITLVFLALYGLLYRALHGSAAGSYLLRMLELTAVISLGLAVFNLLPIPPLDGSKIMFTFLPDKAVEFFYRYQMIFFAALFVLLWTGPLSYVLGFLSRWVSFGLYTLTALPFQAFGVETVPFNIFYAL